MEIDEEEEDAALFAQMLSNISLDSSQDEEQDQDDGGILGSSFRDRLLALQEEADLSDDLSIAGADAADPFALLDESLLEEEDDGTPIALPFMNIQLMACKKLDRQLEMIHKRRSLSDWSSFTCAERAAETAALAHRNNCLGRRTLREWRRTTRHLIYRRETALKRLERSRRLLVLRSTFRSWVAVHTRSRFVESLSAIICRRQTKDACNSCIVMRS